MNGPSNGPFMQPTQNAVATNTSVNNHPPQGFGSAESGKQNVCQNGCSHGPLDHPRVTSPASATFTVDTPGIQGQETLDLTTGRPLRDQQIAESDCGEPRQLNVALKAGNKRTNIPSTEDEPAAKTSHVDRPAEVSISKPSQTPAADPQACQQSMLSGDKTRNQPAQTVTENNQEVEENSKPANKSSRVNSLAEDGVTEPSTSSSGSPQVCQPPEDNIRNQPAQTDTGNSQEAEENTEATKKNTKNSSTTPLLKHRLYITKPNQNTDSSVNTVCSTTRTCSGK